MFALFLALSFSSTKAQTDSTQVAADSVVKAKPQFKLSLNYNSNLNYYGRTDSLKSSGIFPLAELWITPKFYLNAAPIFINNSLQSFDYAGAVATIGYQHLTEKWLNHIYLLKPFYEPSSQLVQSALKAQAGASFSRLNKVANITLGADAKLTNEVDFGAMAGLDHIIRMENKNNGVWVLNPSVYAYAGTQQFSRTYTVPKKKGLLQPATQQRVTEEVKTFSLLAYEASLPVVYAKGPWQWLLTPSYVIPQNLIQVPGRPDLSEQGQNTFYATFTVKHTF